MLNNNNKLVSTKKSKPEAKSNLVNGFEYKTDQVLLFKLKDYEKRKHKLQSGVLHRNNVFVGCLVSIIEPSKSLIEKDTLSLVVLPFMNTDDPCKWTSKIPVGTGYFLDVEDIESISIMGIYTTNILSDTIDVKPELETLLLLDKEK